MVTYPCLRCRELYEQNRRRASHFCPTCRTERKRERDRERMQNIRAVRAEVQQHVDAYVDQGMERDYVEAFAYPRLDDYLAQLEHDDKGLVPDRMPAGANSPAGPEDGRSTYFTDLAEELDRLSNEAAAHPWFAANPHWAYELHDPYAASTYLHNAA